MFWLFKGCVSVPFLVVILMIQSFATSCFCIEQSNEEPYIVDHRYPLMISDKASNEDTDTLFGMSVALSTGPDGDYSRRPSGWIFIGAPNSNSTDPTYTQINAPGVLWRCSLGRKRDSDTCEIMNIDPSIKRKEASPMKEDEGNSFIGGTTEIQNGRLVTCGPRWTRGDRTFMNGLCYWLTDKGTNKSFQNEEFIVEKNTKAFHHRLFPFFNSIDSIFDGKNVRKGILTIYEKDQNFNITYNGIISNESGYEWGLGQAGFSLHMMKNISGGSEILLGAPGVRIWSGAVVRYRDNHNPSNSIEPKIRLNRNKTDPTFSEFVVAYRGTKEIYEDNYWHDYFGYAVSSGKYFNNQTILYAGGAPRGNNLSGEVVLFDIPDLQNLTDLDESNKQSIHPLFVVKPPMNAFGSYFGSVLLTLDIDGDGLDELLVGAPLNTVRNLRRKRNVEENEPYNMLRDEEGNTFQKQKWFGDHGCVFVFYFGLNTNGSSSESFLITQTQILNGSLSPGSRFGSAMSYLRMNDLYIVVGAPYENDGRGAVYIYKAEKILGAYVQRILSEYVSSALAGFGCSISLPTDIDDNSTPDLAIGAYKSKQVVILRTRSNIGLIGEIKFPDLEKSFKKIPRGAKQIKFQVCLKVETKFGKVLPQLVVWTRLTLDTRLSMPASWFSKRNPSSKISNNTVIYSTTVLTTSKFPNCIEINATINDPTQFEDKDTNPEPITVIHDMWYNETSEPGQHLLEYNALSGLKTNVNLTSSNSSDFKTFGSQKPYSVSSMSHTYLVEVSPNDCKLDVCDPKLNISAEWFLYDDQTDSFHQNPIKEFNIGMFRHLVLQANITNNGETAIKPRFTIEWRRRGVSVSIEKGDFWLLKRSCKPISLGDGLAYNCNFTQNLVRNETVSRNFILDMNEVFAKQPRENFTVSISVYPLDQQNTYETFRDSSLILKADSKVTLVGSREKDTLRSPFDFNCTEFKFDKITDNKSNGEQTLKLYASWRQTYTAHIMGSSGVEAMTLSFNLPWGRKIKENESPKPVVLVYHNPKTKKENVHCEIPEGKGHFYVVRASNANITDPATDTGPHDDVAAEIGGGEARSSISDKSSVKVQRRRRQAVSIDYKMEKTIVKEKQFQIQDNMVKIHCNDETSEFVCVEVHCTATNVRAGSYLETAFDFYLVKDSIDELMLDGKQDVLVESTGTATIFEKSHEMDYYMDDDVSQTWFVPVQGTVSWWIYILSSACGILQLALIVFILYKCGFFKRDTKMQLENMKAEARKSMMPMKFDENKDDAESQELIDRDEMEERKMDSVPEGQSVVERL